jgi:hypothetical protein
VFGPPEQLLSDQGRNFVGGVIEHLCNKVGTRKIFTSAYHPQTKGFVERYNRTLCTELRRHLMTEEEWDVTLALAQFKYNSTRHAATGMIPTARVHFNRMRRCSSQEAEDARDPKVGLCPESRRVVHSILERRDREGRVEYRIPKVGRRGSA